MTLNDAYNRMQESIFSQNLDGVYIKRRPSKCNKKIMALAIINLALAFSSLYCYYNTKTTNIPYIDNTQSTVFLPKGTSYIYISLEGIYQNYLSYTKSINYSQLKGKTNDLNLSSTEPFSYYKGKPYYPAGAIAATYFQDNIFIDNLEIDTDDISRGVDQNLIGFTEYTPDQIQIPMNWTNKTNIGTTPLNTFEDSGLPILNERFVNWISLSPFSNFKKLWGKVSVEESGNYNLFIDSNYELATKKSIFISEKSILGIPNYYAILGIMAIVVVCVLNILYLNKYGY